MNKPKAKYIYGRNELDKLINDFKKMKEEEREFFLKCFSIDVSAKEIVRLVFILYAYMDDDDKFFNSIDQNREIVKKIKEISSAVSHEWITTAPSYV